MTAWSEPAEIARDAQIFQKILLFLLGLYVWEVLGSLAFDWTIITRKRQFRWPMIFYFWNTATNVTTKVQCQTLYGFNQFAGNTAIGTASTLLVLRTVAVWARKLYIIIPLVILSLGHWTVLFHGVATVQSNWSVTDNACIVSGTEPAFINLLYIYTMLFDLVVLLLTVIGLLLSPGRSSNLWTLLFKDGVVYFIVAFSVNLISTVFLLMNLNPVMNVMFTVPAATASAIVSCRVFVRLSQFTSRDVYFHSTSIVGNTPQVGSQRNSVNLVFRNMGSNPENKANADPEIALNMYATAGKISGDETLAAGRISQTIKLDRQPSEEMEEKKFGVSVDGAV
ncbi:hypothetical protein BOTBODRAFT_614745 [Botryobasidium botryosum FD-172 SS1]|uniref:Uncharacterized protein n=1 Tax=Botryobasidium botryosum (strain FD-172 SS1) TaxID=930990 RepID=A0A067LV02_BOTB1|nr:hypothetical protein BOTBODRAFT_614745 [Botryobasidium botryosum FD-172 SS1]